MSGAEDDGINAAAYAVDGTLLVPGAEPVTVSGTTYSLTLEAPSLAVNDLMLIPGAKPIIASGLIYSLAPKATAIPINGKTRILFSRARDGINLAAYAVNGKPPVPDARAITVSRITYSLAPQATAFMINDNTLIPVGEPIVASGMLHSFAPYATAIVTLAQGGQNSNGITRSTGYVIGSHGCSWLAYYYNFRKFFLTNVQRKISLSKQQHSNGTLPSGTELEVRSVSISNQIN